MVNGYRKIIVILFSVFVLILIATVIVIELFQMGEFKKESYTQFNKIESTISSGNLKDLKSYLVSDNCSTSKLEYIIVVKNDKPFYFYSTLPVSTDKINTLISESENSLSFYSFNSEFTKDNDFYIVRAMFRYFSSNKIYLLFIKFGTILFLYIIFLLFLIFYEDKQKNTVVKETVSTKNVPRQTEEKITTEDKEKTNDYLNIIDAELKKAAAFDQDIVLILISSQENNISEYSDDFLEILKRNFPFHDLIFKLEDNIFATLLPNCDLEEGIKQIEIFDQIFVSSEKSLKFPIIFGLSSRNGRLIKSQTIIKEAQAALNKAMCEPDYPIIGFRPNPALYREYLSGFDPK